MRYQLNNWIVYNLFCADNEIILPNTWPLLGHIEMKNVYLKYDDEESPVLKDVNITILPGQKVNMPLLLLLISD